MKSLLTLFLALILSGSVFATASLDELMEGRNETNPELFEGSGPYKKIIKF